MSTNDAIQPISHHAVYEVEFAHDGSPECKDSMEAMGMCQSAYSFAWIQRQMCELTFTCATMSGNVCGDYGVTLSVGNDNSSTVCYPRTKQLWEIKMQDRIAVRSWFAKTAVFNAKCYLWCTRGGLVPSFNESHQADQDLIRKLVRQSVRPIAYCFCN